MEKCHLSKIRRDNISSCVEKILGKINFCSCSGSSISEVICYNIKLALWEIFSNFICHGTSESCSDVSVTIDENEREITLQVTSFGNVFKWESFQGVNCPSIEDVRGRGLYIIQQICHEFSYEENGQIANLVFRKGDINVN